MANWLRKEFLLGIGVGCIISAILVSLFGVGTMSDEEIVARASKLGMVKQDMPWNSNTQSTESSGKTSSEKTSSGNDSGGADQSTGTSQPPAANTPENNVDEAKSSAGTAVVTITDRMGSESVARMLEQKGVIKDQDEFLKAVDSHNAQRRFQTGKFTVPVGGDMEEILYILTGKKR